MTIILIALPIAGAMFGAGVTYLAVRPRLEQLRKLTDRDERGRFVRKEKA